MCSGKCNKQNGDLVVQFALALAPIFFDEKCYAAYSRAPIPLVAAAEELWSIAQTFADARPLHTD